MFKTAGYQCAVQRVLYFLWQLASDVSDYFRSNADCGYLERECSDDELISGDVPADNLNFAAGSGVSSNVAAGSCIGDKDLFCERGGLGAVCVSSRRAASVTRVTERSFPASPGPPRSDGGWRFLDLGNRQCFHERTVTLVGF